MKYWLMKTDPDTYSWDDLVREKRSEWDGVRNYEARNNMKKMSVGDLVLVYQSVKNPAVVGIAKVVEDAHPDSTDESKVWWCVDIAPVEPLKRLVTLSEIKTLPECADMVLLKRGRLSVQPVNKKEWDAIVAVSKKKEIGA